MREAERKTEEALVAAAAWVPASSTSRMALWKLCKANYQRYLQENVGGSCGKPGDPELAGDQSCGCCTQSHLGISQQDFLHLVAY